MSHFDGTPFIILEDLLNGYTGVEWVAFLLTVGDLSGTLDGVFGTDAIVGIHSWCKLEGVVFFHLGAGKHLISSYSVVFKHGLMQSHVPSEFLVGIFHPTPVLVTFGSWL